MTFHDGDIVTIDGVEMEVTHASSDGVFFKERKSLSNYYSLVYYLTEDLIKMFSSTRLTIGSHPKVKPGNHHCSYHNWRRYVGAREIYRYCTNCDAKQEVDWRSIKDERSY